MNAKQNLIVRDREILGGMPVFAGTRVPVKTLFDYLKQGYPLDEFLDDFPTVQREHALAVLKNKNDQLAALDREIAIGLEQAKRGECVEFDFDGLMKEVDEELGYKPQANKPERQ